MKIWLGWSGERSRKTALVLSDWLKSVLPDLEPLLAKADPRQSAAMSFSAPEGVEAGAAIFCLSQENANALWTAFEVGALQARYSNNLYCLLVDLKSSEISQPFSYLRHVVPIKTSLGEMMKALNLLTGSLTDEKLEQSFALFYPDFERAFQQILGNGPTSAPAYRQRRPPETDEDRTGNQTVNNLIALIKTFPVMFPTSDQNFAQLQDRQISREDYVEQIDFLLEKTPEYRKGLLARAENDFALLNSIALLQGEEHLSAKFDQVKINRLVAAREKSVDNIAAMIRDYVAIFASNTRDAAQTGGQFIPRASYVNQLKVVMGEVPDCGRSLLQRASNDKALLTGVYLLLTEEQFNTFFSEVFPLEEFDLPDYETLEAAATEHSSPKAHAMHTRGEDEEKTPIPVNRPGLRSLGFVKNMNERSTILIKGSQRVHRNKD